MNRISAFLAGLLVALAGLACAQSSGLPSRPRFQAVTIAQATPSLLLRANGAPVDAKAWFWYVDQVTGGTCLTTQNDAGAVISFPLCIPRTGAAAGPVQLGANTTVSGDLTATGDLVAGPFLRLTSNTNGVLMRDTGQASGSQSVSLSNFSAAWHMRFCNDLLTICGSDAITATRAAGTNNVAQLDLNAATVNVNGIRLPAIWRACVTGASGALCAGSGIGFTAFTRSAVGTYTFTNGAITSSAVCTGSGANSALDRTVNLAALGNTLTVTTRSSGVLTDSDFYVICML